MLVSLLAAFTLGATQPPAADASPFAPPEWVRTEAARIRTAPAKLEAACEGEDQDACADLAYLLATGTKIAADPKRAVAVSRDACKEDSVRACAVFAYLFHGAPELLQDPYASRRAYLRACEGGHAPSCHHAALALERGEALPAADPAAAAALFQKACEGGFAAACGRKAPASATRTKHARVVEDADEEVACDEADDCVLMAYGRLEEGPRRDLVRAERLFLVGCERGHPYGCGVLGELYDRGDDGFAHDAERALDLYEHACARGWRVACARLAAHYWRSSVRGDDDIALGFARRACEAGDLEGCSVLGRLLLVREPPRGYALVSQSCDRGDLDACTWKAIAHKEGWGVKQSLPRAFEILGTACDAESANACHFLGLMLNEGDEPKGGARATAALEKACRLGHERACVVLEKE